MRSNKMINLVIALVITFSFVTGTDPRFAGLIGMSGSDRVLGEQSNFSIQASSYGSSTLDGILNPSENYTTILSATLPTQNFSIYQRNTNSYFYFYFESINPNFTFQEFYLEDNDLVINVSSNNDLTGIYSFVFNANRSGLEFFLIKYLVPSDFAFKINNISFTFSISAFPEPPEEELYYPVGLTEVMQFLGELLFASSWFSVLFWVFFFVWQWRALKRKIWILRDANGFKGYEFGRWIQEDLVNIGGLRLYRHKFKCDLANTAEVRFIYSKWNKEELIGKTGFKRINGYWMAMPYLRIAKFKLRPDQWFAKKIRRKTAFNKFKLFCYYICCWIPKLNDLIYDTIKYDDSKELVKEVDYFYLNFPEEYTIEVYQTTYKQKELDIENQEITWKPMAEKLTKSEINLLEKQVNKDLPDEGNVKDLTIGKNEFVVRTFRTLNEAMEAQLTKEDIIATYRYKILTMDYIIERLNNRLEATINMLENERRGNVEKIQDMLNKTAEHTEWLEQNFPSMLANALGLHKLGLGKMEAIKEALKESLVNYKLHSEEIRRKQEEDQQRDFEKLRKDNRELINELKKKTHLDINPADITIESTNTE